MSSNRPKPGTVEAIASPKIAVGQYSNYKSNVFIFKNCPKILKRKNYCLHPHIIIFTNQSTFHSKLDSHGSVPFSVNKILIALIVLKGRLDNKTESNVCKRNTLILWQQVLQKDIVQVDFHISTFS